MGGGTSDPRHTATCKKAASPTGSSSVRGKRRNGAGEEPKTKKVLKGDRGNCDGSSNQCVTM